MSLLAWFLFYGISSILFSSNVPKLFLWACSKNNFKLLNVLLYFSFTANNIDLTWDNRKQSKYDRMQKVGQYYFPILKAACENENKELFRYLLGKGALIYPKKLVHVLDYDADFIKMCLQSAKNKLNEYRVCQHTNPCICEQFYPCLFHACRFGKKNTVQLLLENDVDIQCMSNSSSALTAAMGSFKGFAIVGWLLDQGAKKYYLRSSGHNFCVGGVIGKKGGINEVIKGFTNLIDLINTEKTGLPLSNPKVLCRSHK